MSICVRYVKKETDNRINIYTCNKCKKSIITVDIVDGIIPFMIGCKATENCNGDMYSSFYQVDQSLIPQYEWYRPSIEEYKHCSKLHQDFMKRHIEDGGLDIRKIIGNK
jgi:hypothetical protein